MKTSLILLILGETETSRDYTRNSPSLDFSSSSQVGYIFKKKKTKTSKKQSCMLIFSFFPNFPGKTEPPTATM